MNSEPRIGLALGSGGARGAAHTGILKVLDREGIRPTVVAGSSIGSLIGAAYAAGKPTADMEKEWLAVGVSKVLRGFMPTFPSAGLSSGHELRKLLHGLFGDVTIEDLAIPFAAVACDIDTGEPVVLKTGSLVDAVLASTAIPGIFFPVRHGSRILVDGGMVDPVPVSVCRNLGADIVIAVDITARPVPTTPSGRGVWNRIGDHVHDGLSQQTWLPASLTEWLEAAFRERPERPLPGLYSILNQSVSILLQEIVRQRLVLDPPEVLIRPELSLTILGFRQAREGIEAGERAAEAALPQLQRVLAERSAG
ncbi:MAG: patatin-like phospholipase family protein [Candidatus Bipolaricaulota bacterium]|jgi:NTE family protein|nr:patatin-like phospholipase family protein [Candidatus Bipolaricaulota bacterium]